MLSLRLDPCGYLFALLQKISRVLKYIKPSLLFPLLFQLPQFRSIISVLNPTFKFPIWQMCRLEDSYRELSNMLAPLVDLAPLQPYLHHSVKLCLQLRMLIVYLAYAMAILTIFPIFMMMVVDLGLYATRVLHLRTARKMPVPFQNKKSQEGLAAPTDRLQLQHGSSLTSLSSLRSSSSIASSLNVPTTENFPTIHITDVQRRIPRKLND